MAAQKKSGAKSEKAVKRPAKPAKVIAATKGKKRPIEQYDHKDKKRVNNPPVGLVSEKTDKETGKKTYAYDPHIDPALQFDSQRSQVEKIIDCGLSAKTIEQAKAALAELKKRQEPYLNWAGKAEHTSFEVSTLSLHVHERIDPRTIIEAVRKRNGSGAQTSFFSQLDEQLPLREAVEFYRHPHGWSNRLIAGDSLLVMNSLLEKEGLAGQVQMIYIDPPYGIKYGSNFQPFVNKRDVKDGKDEDLTAEPEQVLAFRDTWELGIHSYLTYLRDRLLMARDLLTESGSVFVQISDENVHHVRELMDEVFGAGNFVVQITFRKTLGNVQTKTTPIVCDYLLQYARDKDQLKHRQVFKEKNSGEDGTAEFRNVELADGSIRRLSDEEYKTPSLLPRGSRVFATVPIVSAGYSDKGSQDIELSFEGKSYTLRCGPKRHWSVGVEGTQRLWQIGRLLRQEGLRIFKSYLSDFPYSPLTNVWVDTRGETDMSYVVQTNRLVIERCLLMTTDPGDLVFDPTCGSGTTAYVAEQWGRRWITCDTSRVALTLAKQRLMTSVFDYYELAHPEEGVGSGFVYKTVSHITRSSVAHNEPPPNETLYDQPHIDSSKARVSGPFTVEAVPAPLVKPLSDIGEEPASDDSVSRSGETLRQSEWRDELFKTGIRGKGGQKIEFTRVETFPATRHLHADAETKEDKPQRVVVSFGPEHAPLEQKQVELAFYEARKLVPTPNIVLFAAFQFDPEAAKDIDETDWPGVTLLKAQMNTDLLTDDLKKKRSSNESFWLIGQPDAVVREIKERGQTTKYQIELLGFDYYNVKTGAVESGGTDKIAMWLLDTDYDGRSLFPKQVFFPMASESEGWAKLARNLKAEIDEELIEAYRGTVSIPFEPGQYKRIAVKIIDDRGIESLRVVEL